MAFREPRLISSICNLYAFDAVNDYLFILDIAIDKVHKVETLGGHVLSLQNPPTLLLNHKEPILILRTPLKPILERVPFYDRSQDLAHAEIIGLLNDNDIFGGHPETV